MREWESVRVGECESVGERVGESEGGECEEWRVSGGECEEVGEWSGESGGECGRVEWEWEEECEGECVRVRVRECEGGRQGVRVRVCGRVRVRGSEGECVGE